LPYNAEEDLKILKGGKEMQYLMSTVPKSNNYPDLQNNETLRLVAQDLELSNEDLANEIAVRVSSIRWDDSMPPKLRQRLREYALISDHILNYFEGDKARTAHWFKIPNPLLGGLSPRQMVSLGNGIKLQEIIVNQIHGNQY
jgi:hypothetical protein